jgi:bifunctional non-homologous end joining protein LigD
MSRTSTLPKRLQPMLATLTDAPFDDPGWVFEDKYDGFRMIAEIRRGKVALYSRNGKIISRSYMEVAKALEGVKGDAVIDGELVAIGKDGVSHFQLLQNALRHEAKLLYCAFDLMFENAVDLRKQPLLKRKKRLKAILPRDKLIAFSAHRKGDGTKFFAEAERKGLEGIMAKRADSAYTSGSRSPDWLKIKTAKRQEVVIAGFPAPRRTRPFFGALVLAVREDDAWRYIGHVGTGFSHKGPGRPPCQAREAGGSKITLSCQSEGRGRHDLGHWLPRSNLRSGRARANCVSPSTSDSDPTSGRRMSCANENVRANSDSFAAVSSVASKVVDFRSYALRRDFERRKRDRQLEAPPSRAAGIQVENAADRVDLRYVGMPGDDHVDAGAGVDLQRLQVVQNVNRLSRQTHKFRVGVFAGPLTAVHISTDGGDGRDPAKRVDDLSAPDVAGVNDASNTSLARPIREGTVFWSD